MSWQVTPPRRTTVLAISTAVSVLAFAATSRGEAARQSVLGDTSSLNRAFCAVPQELRGRIARGYRPDRGGDIQFVPEEPNFVSAGISHAGPWDYLQDVPMLWYGPGYVRRGVYGEPVTLADVAPTQAALLKFPFSAPHGRPLREALLPASRRPVPRLVVTLVWDGAGLNVLRTWRRDWPVLRSLVDDGAWFPHASVGSSPSNTPPSHATIGTGAFPDRNGVVDEYIRYGTTMQKPYDQGPGVLVAPTLGDLYDRAMGNEPLVGTIATLDAHLSMMSHGSLWGGGDRDIAVARQKESVKGGAEGLHWNLPPSMAPYYRFPAYVNQVPGFETDKSALDRQDGRLDGSWRQNSITQFNEGFDTPARIPYETRVIRAVVQHEGFGTDRIPDLLDLNYKAIDAIGHMFTVNSAEMQDAIEMQDDDLEQLVAFLNGVVGRDRWVMALIADHGHQYDPAVSGAFEIGIDQMARAVRDRFDDGDDVPLIQWIRPTEVWLDHQELRQGGATLTDVAAFIAGLTKSDTAKPGTSLPAERASDRVFTGAFPSVMLMQPSLCG